MSEKATVEFYHKHAKHWADGYNYDENSPLLVRAKYAVELAKRIGAKRALDAGCGSGHLVSFMEAAGIPCDGIDFSPDMLAIAEKNRKGNEVGRLTRGNLERIDSYPSESYDLITAYGVLVHEIDEDAVLKNFYQKLRPGGRVVISFKNDLFALFSQNGYTQDFFRRLLAPVGTTDTEKSKILDAVTAGCVKTELAAPLDQDKKKEFHKFHNPLVIGQLFERNGFAVEDTFYLHMHPAPPHLLSQIGEEKAVEARMQAELARAWQGAFLASGFLINAVKRSSL